MRSGQYFIQLIFGLLLLGCSTKQRKPSFDFSETKQKLIPLHQKMGEPLAGDWLSYHTEKNLTLEQYMAKKPVRPTKQRNKIYLQPIGVFDAYELRLIQTTSNYLSTFYGLETTLLPTIHDSVIPSKNRRYQYNPIFSADGAHVIEEVIDSTSVQLQTKYILYELLKPALPSDACVLLALCDKDLYPDETYNYVFGQASLKDRVGVWSFARFGNLYNGDEFNKVLIRTLKTASHETGHMFSIKHCSRYRCIMNGSNHLDEADQKPTYFCPDCLEKYCWNFNQKPQEYFERLREFWIQEGIGREAHQYVKFKKALDK